MGEIEGSLDGKKLGSNVGSVDGTSVGNVVGVAGLNT